MPFNSISAEMKRSMLPSVADSGSRTATSKMATEIARDIDAILAVHAMAKALCRASDPARLVFRQLPVPMDRPVGPARRLPAWLLRASRRNPAHRRP